MGASSIERKFRWMSTSGKLVLYSLSKEIDRRHGGDIMSTNSKGKSAQLNFTAKAFRKLRKINLKVKEISIRDIKDYLDVKSRFFNSSAIWFE